MVGAEVACAVMIIEESELVRVMFAFADIVAPKDVVEKTS